MMRNTTIRRLLFAWLPLSVLLLAIGLRLLAGPRTIDDSFITYRYARNILNGDGFVYNPGERVLGTTTPLYTMLMAGLGLFGGGTQAPFPIISMLVNALADGLTCILLLRLGKQLSFRFAGIGAALAWAVAPYSVTFAIGGLETSVYVLLLVGTVSAFVDRHLRLAALLATLSILTRPDALILIAPLALDWLFRNQQSPIYNLQSLLAFILPGAAWGLFATLYFGTPIPHSVTAKSVAYLLPPEAGLVRLLQHYGTPFMENQTFGTGWIGVGLVLYLFLYLVGALKAYRTTSRIWPFLVYPWAYLIIFSVANPLIFRWYMTPPLPPYFLFILAGAEVILTQAANMLARGKASETQGRAETLSTSSGIETQNLASLRSQIAHHNSGSMKSAPRKSPPPVIAQVLIVLIVIIMPTMLSLREWKLHPDHGLTRPAPDMAWYKLELLYRQAADRLLEDMHQRGQPFPVLAAGDVGVLGFYTGVHILDTVGLNSPQATQYYPLDPSLYVTNYAIPPDLIIDQQPDYLVILEVYGRRGLLVDQRFQNDYRLLERLPTDIYGSDGMLLFVRQGIGAQP